MKLNRRNSRHDHRQDRAPRVAISQAEITADLLYPASRRPAADGISSTTRGRRR